ncbi:MAG: hypothetical protein IPL35_00895 [Sphingobacteriales bacterium]|nr:hypothetical protein [Sphingobacteriales bacterium]
MWASTACEHKDTPDPNSGTFNVSSGVLIANEGNFGAGTASISHYNPNTATATEDVFAAANDNRPLGDVCQSVTKFNNKIYAVVNNSSKIEVLDPLTAVSVATISGVAAPRYLQGFGNAKALVSSNSNHLSLLDLNNNSIIKTIPTQGSTEKMLLHDGKIYIANYGGNKVYVFDTATENLSDSLTVGAGAAQLQIDKNGKLWVLCAYNYFLENVPLLQRVDLNTKQILNFGFSDNSYPDELAINAAGDKLYFINDAVYEVHVDSTSANTPFFSSAGGTLYSLACNAANGEIYVSDALDFQQKGKVYRLSAQGVPIDTFQVGIIPGDIYFLP